jgi:hypothetical protein
VLLIESDHPGVFRVALCDHLRCLDVGGVGGDDDGDDGQFVAAVRASSNARFANRRTRRCRAICKTTENPTSPRITSKKRKYQPWANPADVIGPSTGTLNSAHPFNEALR